jgi:hypothetical protein
MDAQLDVSSTGRVSRLEVLEGPTSRRQRSEAKQARIAAESFRPGVNRSTQPNLRRNNHEINPTDRPLHSRAASCREARHRKPSRQIRSAGGSRANRSPTSRRAARKRERLGLDIRSLSTVAVHAISEGACQCGMFSQILALRAKPCSGCRQTPYLNSDALE